MESSFSAAPATDLSGLHVGSKVRHDRFGEGEIVSIEGEGGNAKATVAFDHFGQKQLLLKFAKLTMLNDWRLAYGMSGHATSRIVFRTAFRTTFRMTKVLVFSWLNEKGIAFSHCVSHYYI